MRTTEPYPPRQDSFFDGYVVHFVLYMDRVIQRMLFCFQFSEDTAAAMRIGVEGLG